MRSSQDPQRVRAHSLLTIKLGLDQGMGAQGYWVIQGIATSPAVNSHGDVLVSENVRYKLPLPLLLRHNDALPVGLVTDASVSACAIWFEARLPVLSDNGVLKDRIDDAVWALRTGKIAAVSTRHPHLPGALERLPGHSPGHRINHRINAWRWEELSLCEAGANPDAKIETVREVRWHQS